MEDAWVSGINITCPPVQLINSRNKFTIDQLLKCTLASIRAYNGIYLFGKVNGKF